MESSENKVKDKGEHIRGRDLKISERDIFGSLPFFGRVRAWLFGGVFGMRDPDPKVKLPKMVIVFIPSAPMRFYYKHIYRHKSSKGETKDE